MSGEISLVINHGQGALEFQLTRAAESLDAMVLLAMRGVERVEELELKLRQITATGNAFTMAEGSAADCEVLLRALDVLDRDMQTELANKGQDAAADETRSRILIVRGKLQLKQQELAGCKQGGAS